MSNATVSQNMEVTSYQHLQKQELACQYIFNQQNLTNYETASIQSISFIHRAVNRATSVYSGQMANQLASKITDLDIDLPLNSFNEVLAEVDELYLKNAVYFHNPKYVAHLNCPVAYPAVVAEQVLTAIN
ncbi:MAG: hypothetical protein HRT38_18165 [Alteromonadaceae bacterium]|nr:hypothetical protein [Alteromonadaceae bacterium]